MISLDLFTPLFFFFALYLVIQIAKINLFFVYLLQLKEYRWDRIRVHFKTITGKQQLKDYFNLLKWRKIYRPRLTIRASFILLLLLLGQYNLFFFTLRYSFRLFKKFPASTIVLFFLTLFIVNIGTPLLAFLFSELSHFFLWPARQLIISLAKRKIRKMENLLVIGITGSYGKTAVKELMGAVLSGFFNTLKTPFNCNTELGIAVLILKKLRFKHEIFVVEMGAYKRGEIEDICLMVRPKIGIITGINEQHLALFGSLHNTQWAKFELIKSLPKDGLAIFNGQDKYCRRLYKKTRIEKKLYGRQRIRFNSKLAGAWHRENIQAVMAVVNYLKINGRKAVKILSDLEELPLALKVRKGFKGSLLIDDSYSANPKGFLEALKFFKKVGLRERILVTPGIIELGQKSGVIHKKIGQKASRICTKVFLTKSDFKIEIEKGIARSKDKNFIEVEEDEIALTLRLKDILTKQTAVLMEGRVPKYLIEGLVER